MIIKEYINVFNKTFVLVNIMDEHYGHYKLLKNLVKNTTKVFTAIDTFS